MFERLLALFLLIFFSPVFFILYILIKLTSQGPFLFKQLRAGKNKKPFWIYKIRTMVENAEDLKEKIKHLNQADGPVFKVYDDPRFTKIGRFLAKIGIDELPQLINIVKGQMSFVGPRPFPLDEAKKIPKKYEKRFLVLPGIFSSWVAYGAFHNDFEKWMELDLEDVENKSFWYDLKIVINSLGFVLKLIVRSVKSSINV
jgi:lipopolysaccharide/colanic/teichoic acid biosynthesis glycosyltransferase